jgi:hypothetical protein
VHIPTRRRHVPELAQREATLRKPETCTSENLSQASPLLGTTQRPSYSPPADTVLVDSRACRSSTQGITREFNPRDLRLPQLQGSKS